MVEQSFDQPLLKMHWSTYGQTIGTQSKSVQGEMILRDSEGGRRIAVISLSCILACAVALVVIDSQDGLSVDLVQQVTTATAWARTVIGKVPSCLLTPST